MNTNTLSMLFVKFQIADDEVLRLEDVLSAMIEKRTALLDDIKNNDAISETLKTVGIVHKDMIYTLQGTVNNPNFYKLFSSKYDAPKQSYNLDDDLGIEK